jgi:hypothetical protein
MPCKPADIAELPSEEGETYSHDLEVPKGSVKVGDIVRIEIRPG